MQVNNALDRKYANILPNAVGFGSAAQGILMKSCKLLCRIFSYVLF
jgi:hypothetical protein